MVKVEKTYFFLFDDQFIYSSFSDTMGKKNRDDEMDSETQLLNILKVSWVTVYIFFVIIFNSLI